MRAIGAFFIFFGWLSSIGGYGPSQVGMILAGAALYAGGVYLGKR